MSTTTISNEIKDTEEKPFDLTKAFKLRYKNCLSYQEIADNMGVPKATVHSRLSKLASLLPSPDEIEAYRQNKVDIMEAAQLKIINKIMDNETIKSASLNNAAYTYQALYNCHRLEAGKSTSNISVAEVQGTISDLQAQADALRKSL